ncbi:MAG: phosphatidylglycerophosphatase A [Gammaproteobacteria bacterium]|nr:phosphatidylglycerophosphatase A [Gammaproteobacteria bacterium]
MSEKISPTQLLKDPGHLLSMGFGSGLAPIASGTIGTLAAIPLYVMVHYLSVTGFIVFTLVSILGGIYLCDRTARVLGMEDPSVIVWDEFAGFFVTMLWVPMSVKTVVIGFFLFRFFDIAKPWPASYADRKLHGGLGVMLDDVFAGLYAGGMLYLVHRWWP